MIVSRLARLLKARKMSISELHRQSGVRYASLHALARGTTHRYDGATLDAVCDTLGVGVGDILEHIPDVPVGGYVSRDEAERPLQGANIGCADVVLDMMSPPD
jgi:DNA-binding Xre family transcriptional regulator